MISLRRRSDGASAFADTEAQAQMLCVQGYDRLEGEADVASVDASADDPADTTAPEQPAAEASPERPSSGSTRGRWASRTAPAEPTPE